MVQGDLEKVATRGGDKKKKPELVSLQYTPPYPTHTHSLSLSLSLSLSGAGVFGEGERGTGGEERCPLWDLELRRCERRRERLGREEGDEEGTRKRE